MSQIATYHRPTSSQLVARILDTPDLANQVQALPAPVLAGLIDRVGLEGAGEIVALATTDQLAEIFDTDLWQSDRPGEDERFDAERFLVWLQAMREAGDPFVAQKLVELPEDLVTLAFHRQVLVVDFDRLKGEIESEGEDSTTEKALSSCLSEEIDQYQIISRHHDGWDDVLAALVALDENHHDFLMGMLERCCKLSADYVDDNGGLYEVLTSEETLEADLAGDREDRRARAGHVAPSAAAAFLKLARGPCETPVTQHDAMTRAYFRGLDAAAPRTEKAPRSAPGPELLALLERAGIGEPTDVPRLPAAHSKGEPEADEPLLVRAMRRLSEKEPRVFFERSEQLAYLANVLSSGCTFRGRRMRPIESVRASLAVCNLGLELGLPSGRGRDPVEAALVVLRDHPADGLFRVAWSRLARDVVGAAASTAERWLGAAAAQSSGDDARAVSRAAARIREATTRGAPWKAAEELDILIGSIDPSDLETLAALLDECPSMGPALAETNGGPMFVSTRADLARVRRFLSK
jgi:Family of unknown function (DUF6178)